MCSSWGRGFQEMGGPHPAVGSLVLRKLTQAGAKQGEGDRI